MTKENQNTKKTDVGAGFKPAPEDQNKIQHFSMNLPKGGGAISGMGEKFQANAVTGTGSFTVPLPISPGRGDFAPQLSLAYNSGSGNSPFGLGWDVGVPSITRKTDKQLPTYIDDCKGAVDCAQDTFILSGAEDLVPVLEKNGDQWQRIVGAGFKPAPTGGNIEYEITIYRPRIEGLFARIEKWQNVETKDVHWQATTKENITSYYGLTTQARIVAHDNPNKIFSWLLERTIDAKGNEIVYEYKQENQDNIPKDITEWQRLKDGFAFNQKYLKRVNYCSTSAEASADKHFHMQLVFDYGEHTTDTPEEVSTWPVRQDPYSEYKPGFEVRTYRLCQRVLMFHNFPKSGYPDDWQLVKSTELNYDERSTMCFLTSAVQKGYKRISSGYETKALPPLEFSYTKPEIDTTIHQVDDESKRNLPVGLDNSTYQWIDLKGEGLSGIMTYQAGQLYYKENLGEGHFGEFTALTKQPHPVVAGGQPLQVSDINGDGTQELVLRSGALNGYFELKDDKWENFIPFEKNPTFDLNDPNSKMIDLNGDGKPDLLITQDDKLVWYESLGTKGYDIPAVGAQRAVPKTEEQGPRIVFADSTQSIHLSDMSGDGLTDIVRIRNGEVCYWPNLGYGKFGHKVEMKKAPRFTVNQKDFNPSNIQLSDLDGSGTTDIFYFGNNQVEYWLNESGNGFSDKQLLDFPLTFDSLTTISFIDLTSKGTMSLVWSTRRPGFNSASAGAMADKQLSYIELMQRKPHLLKEVNNNLGKLVKLSYASSSKYYLEDKKQGHHWVTKLPFPVQVLDTVETLDLISGSRLKSKSIYHHGFYDTFEREFRGFGMVETLDTETFETYSGDPKDYVKPILTKTWFHNGAYIKQDMISSQYKDEYYQGDSQAFLLPDTVIENSQDLDAVSLRQAHRALKGSALRKEIYEYGVETPYQIIEANFNIKTLQPIAAGNEHAVFFPHAHETMTYHYEQNQADPRISHEFNLEVDDYGNTLKTCSIVYPRRAGDDTTTEQQQPYATLTTNEYINKSSPLMGEDLGEGDGEGVYLIGIPKQTKAFELNAIPISALNQVDFTDLKSAVINALQNPLNPDQPFTPGQLQARLIQWTRNYFWNQDQTEHLPLGAITAQALVHHTELASLTPNVLTDVYNDQLIGAQVEAAGYVLQDGYYWNPGLIQHYTIGNFYMPNKTEDPFGGIVTVNYDDYAFIPIRTEDALGNVSLAKIDYRTLQPWQLIDPNENKSESITDPMGMVIATSVYGTELGITKGDTPIFDPNGDPIYQIQTDASVTNVLADPGKYLQEATTFFYYDLDAWKDRSEPPQSILIAREIHVSDVGAQRAVPLQRTIAYSDGFGRELQTKLKVEPGLAWVKQADDTFTEEWSEDRWLSSGRTVYNNKEKPIKQYEPFYVAGHNYSSESFFGSYGVTPILHYDPLLRVIRTDTPKGFFIKVEFTPWEIRKYDENDTVLDSIFYSNFPSPPWGEDEGEGQALSKAVAHYNTPQVSLLDTLGREYQSIEYLTDKDTASNDEKLITHTTFNIKGKPLTITDPRQMANQTGIKTFQYTYDMNDQVIRTKNIDAGDDRILNNVLGNPVHAFDSHGHHISMTYDQLQRPIKTHVLGNGLDNNTEQLIYGETLVDAIERNMRGQLYRHYDQAGLNEVERYTFKAEPSITHRSIREEYKDEANWIDGEDWNLLLVGAQRAVPNNFPIKYTTTTQYDALGRVISQDNPDTSNIQPEYHASGKLNKVKAKLKGETDHQDFVTGITYNSKGQRERITYGNNTETTYTYERETFRLTSLNTIRVGATGGSPLQNISYTYDPVGNITNIRDDSHDRVFHNNQVVDPEHKYVYDSLYRLLETTGREHVGLNVPDYYKNNNSFKQSSWLHLENTDDASKLANYTRKFDYDQAGNLHRIQHLGTSPFTREIAVDELTNRAILKETPDPIDFSQFFDPNGNCTQLENIASLDWNYRDNISKAVVIERTSDPDDAEYYVYDSQGNRVRKIKETYKGGGVTEVEEKIYLGGVEIKRIYQNETTLLERTSLHVMDDQKRLAIAHNWSQDDQLRELNNTSELNTNKIRYQFENHLGSASLELDTQGLVISYEEYFPYGGTSFIAGTNQKEVKLKEYRYSGKERDDTTGLYYYGARYYAPWLGRWMSCDPKGMEGSKFNMYWYTSGNPINRIDPDGQKDKNNNSLSDYDVKKNGVYNSVTFKGENTVLHEGAIKAGFSNWKEALNKGIFINSKGGKVLSNKEIKGWFSETGEWKKVEGASLKDVTLLSFEPIANKIQKGLNKLNPESNISVKLALKFEGPDTIIKLPFTKLKFRDSIEKSTKFGDSPLSMNLSMTAKMTEQGIQLNPGVEIGASYKGLSSKVDPFKLKQNSSLKIGKSEFNYGGHLKDEPGIDWGSSQDVGDGISFGRDFQLDLDPEQIQKAMKTLSKAALALLLAIATVAAIMAGLGSLNSPTPAFNQFMLTPNQGGRFNNGYIPIS
jgi:RHS repeat-associated protein